MASELQLDPSDVARRPPRLSIDEMERQLAAAMPETEPSAGGMSAVAVDLLQRGLVKPATDLVTGYRAGAAGIYGTLANIAMLLNHAKDELAHVTGMGTPRAETHDPAVEAWLRRAARRMQPDSLPDDVGGKIYAGLGRAPADIAMYLAGTRALGPIFGMAGVEALREADKGPAAAATGAAKGALLGGTLKAAEKLGLPGRAAALGTVGGAQAAAEGGDVGDVAAGAATMGALGSAARGSRVPPPDRTMAARMSIEDVQRLVDERADGSSVGEVPAARTAPSVASAQAQRPPVELNEPAPITIEVNKGRAAAAQVLDTGQSIEGAMWRDDVGPITFDLGMPGTPRKRYADGWGLSHIVARRNLEGVDGDAFVRRTLPEVISHGRLLRIYGPPNGRRADIVLGDDVAVLSLYRLENRETWVLTGFGKRSNP